MATPEEYAQSLNRLYFQSQPSAEDRNHWKLRLMNPATRIERPPQSPVRVAYTEKVLSVKEARKIFDRPDSALPETFSPSARDQRARTAADAAMVLALSSSSAPFGLSSSSSSAVPTAVPSSSHSPRDRGVSRLEPAAAAVERRGVKQTASIREGGEKGDRSQHEPVLKRSMSCLCLLEVPSQSSGHIRRPQAAVSTAVCLLRAAHRDLSPSQESKTAEPLGSSQSLRRSFSSPLPVSVNTDAAEGIAVSNHATVTSPAGAVDAPSSSEMPRVILPELTERTEKDGGWDQPMKENVVGDSREREEDQETQREQGGEEEGEGDSPSNDSEGDSDGPPTPFQSAPLPNSSVLADFSADYLNKQRKTPVASRGYFFSGGVPVFARGADVLLGTSATVITAPPSQVRIEEEYIKPPREGDRHNVPLPAWLRRTPSLEEAIERAQAAGATLAGATLALDEDSDSDMDSVDGDREREREMEETRSDPSGERMEVCQRGETTGEKRARMANRGWLERVGTSLMQGKLDLGLGGDRKGRRSPPPPGRGVRGAGGGATG
uniref:Uncharacterized protein n=1 Tax=Chromera velia CCMP2878 TaxID=1169474 RepID=A0A0G4FF71_9ALVE|mmetsp:Transcript_48002/g.94778  ORF Transcript_48002/g.94778 Transcript_48002/m.94778 type:complete len:550 (+) Transcript_48002:142-1791(+)|eukprot:Cvel_16563.t1-p1 / transcript=Cvel_16563.t1 / gene=Cvel_16563 / organism=Chromera_velia_CCMP2878 / gene_product=hypothetical protein / transcript_product=hypothetical protein / location=Cvel_scaffold1281:18604-20777(+) / protein_length=549 / sequence_SO=supercontig / SO=protein_coding / is_pseudo=false